MLEEETKSKRGGPVQSRREYCTVDLYDQEASGGTPLEDFEFPTDYPRSIVTSGRKRIVLEVTHSDCSYNVVRGYNLLGVVDAETGEKLYSVAAWN